MCRILNGEQAREIKERIECRNEYRRAYQKARGGSRIPREDSGMGGGIFLSKEEEQVVLEISKWGISKVNVVEVTIFRGTVLGAGKGGREAGRWPKKGRL